MKHFHLTTIFLLSIAFVVVIVVGCSQAQLDNDSLNAPEQNVTHQEQEREQQEEEISKNPEDVTVDDIIRFVSDKEQLPEDFIIEQDTSTWQEVVLEEEGVSFKMPKHWTIRNDTDSYYCINDPETFKEEGYVIGTWDCRIIFSVDDVKLSDILQVIEKRDNWYDMQYNVSTIDNHTAVFSNGFGINVDIFLDDFVAGFTLIESFQLDSAITQDFFTMTLTFETNSE